MDVNKNYFMFWNRMLSQSGELLQFKYCWHGKKPQFSLGSDD